MATSYPGGIDSFTNPDPADALDSVSVPHAGQHSNANDAIEAIETELGTDPAGSESTVADRFDVIEDDDWVVAARIADGAVGTAHLADDAVTVAKITPGAVGTVLGTTVDGDAVGWRFPGPVNLLGSAQASIPTDTTGWVAYNANTTLSFEGGDGKTAAGCLSCTFNATANNSGIGTYRLGTPGVDGRVAVEEGATYTMTAWVKESSGTRGAKVGYFGAATSTGTTPTDSLRYDTTGAVAAGGASGWTLVSGTFTVTPGTGTNFGQFFVFCNSTGSIGDVLLVDDICVYRSPSVSRQIEPGGDPVGNPYAGVLWNEAVGRRGFLWDNYNSRWQMVYGDTGWRDVSGDSSWLKTNVACYTGDINWKNTVRRVGYMVSMRLCVQLTGDVTAGNALIALNAWTGFRPEPGFLITGYNATTGTFIPLRQVGTAAYVTTIQRSGEIIYLSFTAPVIYSEAWPTALPGTAYGSIPSA